MFKMRSKFTYFFLLLWLIPALGFSQATSTIEIKGDVDDLNTGAGLSGVTVSVYKNGSLVESVVTGSGGKYKIKKIDADGVITVKFSKPGFVGKYAEIDASGIHPEDAGIFPLEVSTSIFEQIPDVDFSILDSKPVAKAKYVKGVDNIEWDVTYIEKVKKDVEKIIAKAEDIKKAQADAAAATEKKFNDAVAAGNAAVSTGDYTTAIKKYNEALTVKDDADVKKKIADAETKMKEANSKAETDKKYNDLMAEAKKFFDAKDYASAKQKYQDASAVKTTEVAPKEKIKEIDGILAKQMEDETKYNKYLADGDKALLNSKYDEAIAQFTEASKMRPNEQQPKEQLKKAQDAKKAAEADALAEKKKKEDFDKFVLTADQNVTSKKYDDAIANYEKALALIDDAGVKTKRDNAIKAKEADVAAAQKAEEEKEKERIRREEYDKLMKKGGEEMTATEYEKAIGTFESALIIFPKDVPAETKLAEAKKKRDEKLANDKLAEEQKKNKEKFDALLEKGDGEVGKAEYDKAIATYKEALVIIKDEPTAKSKLADAEKRKNEYVKNKADFDKLVSEGDVAATAKKYDDAIGKFEKALVLFQDATVQSKLDKAKSDKDAANSALEAEKKKNQDKFNELIAQGDSEMSASTFDKAISSYTAALAIFKDDADAKAKLADAEKKKNDFAKNKADFDKLVSEGDLASNGKKYDDAISKYEKAISIFQDATVQSKIDKAKADRDALLSAAEAEKKKKEEFAALLLKGDGEVKSENFDNAIATFEEALILIPKEASAEAKLVDAKKKRDDKLKNNQLAEEQKKKKEEFDKLVAQGDDEMSTTSFDKAIASYTSALAIIKDDTDAKAKLADAQKKKTEADLANKSAEEKYKKHFNDGMAHNNSSEFEKAISDFEAALAVKPGDKPATDALQIAKERLADFKATKDKAYNDRIAMADKLFGEGNYVDAKGYYVKANAQRPEDAHPKDRIVECDTKIKEAENADLAAKEKRKNYDAAIIKADLAFNSSKWDDAIREYELALTFLDEQYPKTKIETATKNRDSEMSAAEAEKKKKEDFNALIKKGDGEVTLEDYDAAIASFEDALNLIPKEPTAEKKLADAKIKKDLKDKADLANKDKALKQEQFDKLLAQGDEEMNAATFDKAINSYTAALAIFKDNTIAKAKLIEAQKKKNEADLANKNAEEEKRLAEEKYKKHFNDGMAHNNSSEFEKAISDFEAALVIKPGDQPATDALQIAKDRLADFKATKDKAYNDRVALADKLFSEGNYVDAKEYYVKANAQRPEDTHPKNRIKECDEKIAADGEMKKLRAQFDAAMEKGDIELNAKNYDKAIAFYEAAKIILPNENTPDIKIAEANRLKELAKSENDEAAKKKKFNQLMNEGNAFMTTGEFDDAISKFEAALDVIPNEPTAEKALALAKQRKKEKEEELEREIQRYLEFADKEFTASNWEGAIKYYEKYLKYKKGDSYAISQIEKCKAKLKEGQTNLNAQSKYDALIKEGNKLFNEKKYESSRDKFVAALDVYGTMPYPTKKIKEIDDLLAKLNTQQAIKDKKQQDEKMKAQKAKGFDYGDKTMMSADDALSLLLASKREDEVKKYDDINKQKELINNQNKDREENSELNRNENFNSIGLQKENMQDYSSNTDFLNNNADLYRKKKDQFDKETRIMYSENDLSRNNKNEIKSLHEEFDMNRFEEKLRFINSKEINKEKDELVSINQRIDSKAAETRNDNGEKLVKLKDLTNDQFSANGEKRIEENSKEIQSDFEKLNVFNKDINERANTVRDDNHDNLRIEQENFAKQNITNQEKMLAVNNEKTKNDFLNQHNKNQEIFTQAELIRIDNNKDMNQRKDDFADRNKNISDQLLKDNAASIKDKHDQTNLLNQELNGLAAETRNQNGELLKTTHDEFANQQKTNQKLILDKNSGDVKSEFENQKLQNNLLDAKAADTRNKNGVDLVAQKDLLANNTNKTSNELLSKNGEEVKSDFDLLNKQNDKQDASATNVRNENGVELIQQQDNLKTMYTKGAESQAEKIRKLKEQQDDLARQQKVNDANASKSRWNNGQNIIEQKDKDLVFDKGEEGYMSSYTKDYPQGVTEEVFTRKNADGDVSEVTVRRIVVKGDHGNEYRKVVSKSGTYYFKNGKTITNQVWDMEAAK